MSAQPIYQPAAPSYRMEVFTPAVAKAILETQNGGNRTIRKGAVDFLASEMASGAWQPASADAICFDHAGNLINGQHRLSAVVQSGVTVSMLVGRNIPASAFQIIDRGAKRVTSDDVSQLGCPNSTMVAALVANYLLACSKGSFDPYQVASNGRVYTKAAAVVEFVTQHFEACTEIGRMRIIARSASPEPRHFLATIMHLHMSGVPLDELRRFVKMVDPEYSGDADNIHPARALSRTLLSAKLGRVRLSFGEVSEFTIRAYNDMVAGETRQIKYHKRGVTPQVKVTA